jgi:hypothetical protein
MMLRNLLAIIQCVFGAGLAGIGLYGTVEAAVPTDLLGLVMAACTVSTGVNVIVTGVRKLQLLATQPKI